MIEEWALVEGWEGLYEVSTLGRVRSMQRVVNDSRGRPYPKPGKILSQATKNTGYRQVSLCREGRQHDVLVHRLTARAFCPGWNPGLEVCHADADRANNKATNLRWGTRQENQAQKVSDGHHPKTQRTKCPRGHALSDPNLCRGQLNSGHRSCLACSRTHARLSYYRKRHNIDLDFQSTSDDYYRKIQKANA